MGGWFLEFPLYLTDMVGWFLEFPLYGTDMVTVRLLQVDPDLPTFRPIDQHKNSDIKYTANGYIPCKG
jgi:hypothetical protein